MLFGGCLDVNDRQVATGEGWGEQESHRVGLVLEQCPGRDMGGRCTKMCGRRSARVTLIFTSFLPHIHAVDTAPLTDSEVFSF